jgi:hypothetical protein
VAKNALVNGETTIELGCENTWKDYQCKIVTSKRCPDEKYLTSGWYQFVKDSNLSRGDLLRFTFPFPAHFVFVQHIRRAQRS